MSPLPCPAYRVLRLLTGKWKPAILFHLRSQTLRFGDLRRCLPEVSQKVLTAQLKELESDGVIIRTLHPDVPPRPAGAGRGWPGERATLSCHRTGLVWRRPDHHPLGAAGVGIPLFTLDLEALR